MAQAGFDLEGARKAGAPDSRIAGFLAERHGFDLEAARAAGASDARIAEFLAARPIGPVQTGYQPHAATVEKLARSRQIAAEQNAAADLSPSVMNDAAPVEDPGRDQTPLRPEVRAGMERAWDRAGPDERIRLEESPNWVGKVARQRADDYRDAADLPATRQFDNRAEVRARVERERGTDPDAAANIGRYGRQDRRTPEVREVAGARGPDAFESDAARDAQAREEAPWGEVLGVGARQAYAGLGRGYMGLGKWAGDVLGIDALADFSDDAADKFGGDMERARNAVVGRIPEDSFRQLVAETAPSAIQQMPVLFGAGAALLLTRNPAAVQQLVTTAALTPIGAQTFGNEYLDGLDAGLTAQQATSRALGMTLAEVVPERLSLNALFDLIGSRTRNGVADWIGAILRQQGIEHTTEQATTIAQFVVDRQYLQPDATLADLAEQMQQTFKATALQAPVLALTGFAGRAAGSAVRRARRDDEDLSAGMQWDVPAERVAADLLSPENAQITAARDEARTSLQDMARQIVAIEAETDSTSPVVAVARSIDERRQQSQTEAPQEAGALDPDALLERVRRALQDGAAFTDPAQPVEPGRTPAGAVIDAGSGWGPAPAGGALPQQPTALPAPRPTAPADVMLMSSGRPFPSERAAAASARQRKLDRVPVAVDGGWGLAPFDQSHVGREIARHWNAFADEAGSLGVPRAEMPQIQSRHRGAMVQFLAARGIRHEQDEVPAASLRPTQAEFSPRKVRLAQDFKGRERSILVSSDGYVLDGHHQWLARRERRQPVSVIRLDAPIADLLPLAREFPSSGQSAGPRATPADTPAPRDGQRLDHGELSIPGRLDGIDAELDRFNREQQRTRRAANREDSSRRREDREQARALHDEYAERIVARHGERFGPKELRRELQRMATWEPRKFIDMVTRFRSETEAVDSEPRFAVVRPDGSTFGRYSERADADAALARAGSDARVVDSRPDEADNRRQEDHREEDPYDNLETRDDTRAAQLDAGRQAAADLRRRFRAHRGRGRTGADDGTVSVLGSRLYEGFVAGRAQQLIGQRVETPADLAALAQVYRDPRFETLRLLYVRNGQVVGESGFSSRLPAVVAVPAREALNDKLRAEIEAFAADGFFVLHNHPSGSAEPSIADVRLTNQIAVDNRQHFRAHVVIDHNEFAVIRDGGNVERVRAPWLDGIDFKSRPELEHRLLGLSISDPQHVAELAKALQIPDGYATAVLTTSAGEVQFIAELPAALVADDSRAALTRVKAATRRMARASGSGGHRFIVLPAGQSPEAFRHLVAEGIVTDVVSADGTALSASAWLFPGDFMTAGRPPVREAREDGEPYRPEPPAETRRRAFQRKHQDQFNRFTVVQDWLKAQDVELSEAANVYRAEERMHGRTATRIEDFRERRVKPLVKEIRRAGFTMSEVADFLHAQHAEERNAQVAKINTEMPDAGSGMTTAEARRRLAEYRDNKPGLEALANKFRAITDDSRQLLLDAGLITAEMSEAWQRTYQHYVPLKGGPVEESAQQGTGRGLTVKARQRRALGHDEREQGEWIVENILRDHERAILQAEKNRVGQHLLAFAVEAANPDLITVGEPVRRRVLRDDKAYEVRYHGTVVEVFHNLRDAQQYIGREALKGGRKPGDFAVTTSHDLDVVFAVSPVLDPFETQVYVKGHAIRVQFKDELLGRAWNNMGAEAMNTIFRLAREVNTWLSKAYTAYNPEFWSVNVQRDFFTGLINMTGEEGIVFAGRAVTNYPRAFTQLMRYVWTGKASQAIQDYRADGGTTGAAYLSDLERIGRDVHASYLSYAGTVEAYRTGGPRRAARVAGKVALNALVGWIEKINQVGENAMRLAIYRTAIDGGRTRAQAAALAKNASANFNRRGEYGQMMGAAYLFFNPAVQGTASIAHALFRAKHKHQAQALVSGIAMLGWWLESTMGGAPEDEWEKVSEFAKERYFHIWMGDGWLRIPIAYGYGFFFGFGRRMHQLQQGEDRGKIAARLAESFVNEFTIWGPTVDPEGDERNLLFLAPTLVQIPGAVAVNQTSLGSPIFPESPFDESRPDSAKMWRATQGSMWAETAAYLNRITGGSAARSGWADVSPETLEYLWQTATGGAGRFFTDSASLLWNVTVEDVPLSDIELREIPVVRKFAADGNDIRGARARYWDAVGETRAAIDTWRRVKKIEDHAERRDEIERSLHEEKELLNLGEAISLYNKHVAAKRDAVEAVMADDSKPLAERRAEVRRIEREEGRLYDSFVSLFKTLDARRKERIAQETP